MKMIVFQFIQLNDSKNSTNNNSSLITVQQLHAYYGSTLS